MNINTYFRVVMVVCVGVSLGAFKGCLSSRGPVFDLSAIKNYQNIIPVAIVGSGPGGLTAGVYGARSGLPTYVFEGDKPGGLLTETTEVENWPGEAIILGPDLIRNMHNQNQIQGVTIVSDTVESIDTTRWPYKLMLEGGDTAYALSVIIATGATPRRLGIPGESEYWGYGVTTCAICDAPFRKGQDVIVIGGGDSAAEEALQLAPHARKVTIMVRKDRMRAAARMQSRLKGYSNIEIRYNVDVKEIIGEQAQGNHGPIKRVAAVRVFDNKENREYIMEDIRGVFLAIGHIPNSALVKGQINCDENGYIVPEERSQRTSKEGVFVAGDVADHTYRQAITSSSSGCKAAIDVTRFFGEIGLEEDVLDSIEPNLYYPGSLEESPVYYVKNMQDLTGLLANVGDKPVIIDFYGQMCPSCLQMLPTFDRVAREASDKAVFVKVDVDEALDIVEHFGVVKVPCILLLKEGRVIETAYKTMKKKELLEMVS